MKFFIVLVTLVSLLMSADAHKINITIVELEYVTDDVNDNVGLLDTPRLIQMVNQKQYGATVQLMKRVDDVMVIRDDQMGEYIDQEKNGLYSDGMKIAMRPEIRKRKILFPLIVTYKMTQTKKEKLRLKRGQTDIVERHLFPKEGNLGGMTLVIMQYNQ
jgi:hypothetical protein